MKARVEGLTDTAADGGELDCVLVDAVLPVAPGEVDGADVNANAVEKILGWLKSS